MASINWTGGSGDWGNAADWNGGVPTNADNVTIGVVGITVTISTTGDAAYTLTTSGSTLSITGGSLFTVSDAVFGGAFLQSGGTYMAAGLGASFAGGIDMTGGIMHAVAGASFEIQGGGTLAGTFTGTGTLAFDSGTTYLNTGFSSTITSIVVGAQVGFDTNFKTGNYFAEQGNGNINLFGHEVTLSGTSVLDGIVGNGTLVDNGTMTLGSSANSPTLDNGLILDVNGHAIQSSSISLGVSDAGAKIAIGRHGQYLINGNWSVGDSSSVGSITNAGLFAKTAGGRTAEINVGFASTGTVEVGAGLLLLNGLVNTLAGTVSGNGTLGIAGGVTTFGTKLALTKLASLEQQSGVLVLNKAQSFAGEWDQSGGVLNLNSTTATLTLAGPSNFDGGTITGYGGTILLNGPTEISNITIGGPTTLSVNGTLDQIGNITFGASSNPLVTISEHATWSIEADGQIDGSFGLVNNEGTFIDPDGVGTALVQSEFESSGTVTVNGSALRFTGPTVLSGFVNGSGLLDLGGNTTLESGLSLTVAEFDVNANVSLAGSLAYAGTFSEANGGTLVLQGNTLDLTGPATFDGGIIGDNGTVVAAGATTVFGITVMSGSTLEITGTAEQAATMQLAGGTLDVAAGATYRLDDDDNIGASSPGGVLLLAGTLAAEGTGISGIGATIDLTGSLQVNDQQLILSGGGTLAGAVAGTGTLVLENSIYTVGAGLSASLPALQVASNAALDVNASAAFGGYFVDNGNIDVSAGDTLSLSGTTVLNTSGQISGAGTLLVSGDTTLTAVNIDGGATLDLTATAEQGQTAISVGATSTLIIGTTSVYTVDAGQSIFGTGTIDLAGTMSFSGDGNSILNPNVVDAGTISNNLGTLNVLGAISGSGGFSIGTAGTLLFAQGSSVSASNSVSFTGAHSALILQDEGNKMIMFGGTLDNFTTGNTVELYDFSAATSSLTLINGTHVEVSDGNGDMITLSFNTTQSLSSLSITSTADGRAILLHH